MNLPCRHSLVILTLLTAGPLAFAAAAAETTAAEVIKQARAFLGGEEALSAVRSIRFSGTVATGEDRTGPIEILVRKPLQQRTTVTIGNGREVTVLNQYEGWSRLQAVDDPQRVRLTVLEAPAVRRLRAEVAENIGFFHGVREVGGSANYLGQVEVEGVPCHQVEFVYGGRIRFVRCFEAATGRLVSTDTGTGTIITESGENIVAGVRFPRQLTSTTNGRTAVVTFDKIEVNVEAEDELFLMPLVLPPSGNPS